MRALESKGKGDVFSRSEQRYIDKKARKETQAKQISEETAMRVARNALAVGPSIWMIGDSTYNTLD